MKKILIIDDNAAFLNTLSDSLPKEKYIVTGAFNGAMGLEKVKEEKPDLVILDMKMPKMGGLEFLKQLREEGLRAKILISSEISHSETISEAMNQGLDLGVVGYIVKSSESTSMIVKEIERIFEKESEEKKD